MVRKHSIPGLSPSERLDFLIECSRTSHEELVFRIGHRDNWLKFQLLTQVALLALTFGIEIAGIRSSSSLPYALALSIPAAFVFAVLYLIEDRLIGLLSNFRKELSKQEQELSAQKTTIDTFESSPQVQIFIRDTLPIRFAAQIAAFVVIPVGLAAYRFIGVQQWLWWNWAELFLDSIFSISIIVLFIVAFRKRYKMSIQN